jgi:hypothetical protein
MGRTLRPVDGWMCIRRWNFQPLRGDESISKATGGRVCLATGRQISGYSLQADGSTHWEGEMNRVERAKLRMYPLKTGDVVACSSSLERGSFSQRRGRSEHGAVGVAGDNRDRGQLQISQIGGATRMALGS